MEGKSRLVLELLRESEEEGEDISFEKMLTRVLEKALELAQYARDLWRLGSLTPRVALALLYLNPDWRPYAKVVAREFLECLVGLEREGCRVEDEEGVQEV